MKQLIFFHATWCNPCKHVEKTYITPLEKKFGARITRIDTRNEPFKADMYKVDRIPTIIVFEGENEVYRKTGTYFNLEALEKMMND